MKFFYVLFISLFALSACNDEGKISNYTVYDYLTNEPTLKNVLNDCTSGKLNDKHTCDTVKRANANLDNFKAGALDEDFLRSLGKK